MSGYSGTAGDDMAWLNGMEFSTKDRDNDIWPDSCAQHFKGAGWYLGCGHPNLNGRYYWQALTYISDSIIWYHWKGYESLRKTEMKIRPNQ